MAKIGTLDDMISETTDNVQDFTVDGECSNCGNCCSNFLPISDREITRIKRYIERHDVKEQIRCFPTAAPMVDMQCPFRDEITKKCLIYPVRPAICVDFRCDKQETEIRLNKSLYHGKYAPVDMRFVFFGKRVLSLLGLA